MRNNRWRRASLAAAAVPVVLLAGPAQAATHYMGYAEWSEVHEGETKGHVNDYCNCGADDMHFSVNHNGNTYWGFRYQSHVGTAWVFYRWNGSNWIVGYEKDWCEGIYAPVPTYGSGGCERNSFG